MTRCVLSTLHLINNCMRDRDGKEFQFFMFTESQLLNLRYQEDLA